MEDHDCTRCPCPNEPTVLRRRLGIGCGRMFESRGERFCGRCQRNKDHTEKHVAGFSPMLTRARMRDKGFRIMRRNLDRRSA